MKNFADKGGYYPKKPRAYANETNIVIKDSSIEVQPDKIARSKATSDSK